jgi:integrase/recombinase XerD
METNHCDGDDPFGECLCRFRAHLESLGYAASTVKGYVFRVRELASLMRDHGVALADLDEPKAIELLAKSKWPNSRGKDAAFIAGRFVRFLAEQGVVPPPTAAANPKPAADPRASLRRDYEAYLRDRRGLSKETIYHCWRLADRFLSFRFGDADVDPSAIRSADVAGFLHRLHPAGQAQGTKTTSTHLRSLFQYLFQAGKTEMNRYGSRVRRHLTPEQVDAVLAAVRSSGAATARRDHAMVLLQARLGLRAPEVVAVRMEDVDWRAGEVLVRGKGGRHDRVPLPPDVGQAIAEYVRLDRVTTSREVFVAERAPHRPFKDGQVLNAILKGAFPRAGVTPPAPYVGSHVLRHSLAVHLVRRGASLDEVGDVLRHRSRASTMLYAKLDVDGLRSVARPWPVPAAAGGVQ